MTVAQTKLDIRTHGRGLLDVTDQISRWVHEQNLQTGLLTVFIRHTSASLTLQENADPDVLVDLNNFFSRLVADDPSLYRHISEGPDDMPSHIRSALTDSSLAIPVGGGRMLLGTWQGIYIFEHRTRPHNRQLVLHLAGE